MKKILLASHGKLAEGMKSTLEFFLGESSDVVAVCAYVEEGDDYLKQLQKFVDSANEEDIIFTDIYGGSVNQQVSAMVLNSGKEIPIITSMNLPIVLSVALSDERITPHRMEQLSVECMPIFVKMQTTNDKEGDEDDFFA